MLAFQARIRMAADVIPWPAVEAALLDVGDIIGREVIAQLVAFVHRAPQLTGLGIDADSDGVVNA